MTATGNAPGHRGHDRDGADLRQYSRSERLRAEHPPDVLGARLLAGFGQTERAEPGRTDAAECAWLKVIRRAENRDARRQAQDEWRASILPTRKQRQILWCLGHLGSASKGQAGVRAIVAELTGTRGGRDE